MADHPAVLCISGGSVDMFTNIYLLDFVLCVDIIKIVGVLTSSPLITDMDS